MAWNSNIFPNPEWQNERGTNVKWTHLMRMFVPSVNVEQMSEQKRGLWKAGSQKIFGNRCNKVWDYIWGGPKEFDRGHMFMWLCKMIYAKIIMGVKFN